MSSKKFNMANIYMKPSNVEFKLPFPSGCIKLRIAYDAQKAVVEMESIDTIFIDKEDLGWLIDVLQDIKTLHKESDLPK